MAANMQHMAGAAGMMQQQRPRPSQVQLNQFLYQTMLAQQQPHSGWQAGVAIQERMIKCHNLITNIGLAVTTLDFMKAAEVGVNFEREAFNKSQDKAQYEAQMSNKTNEFFRRRQANEQNMSNNLQAQAAAQAQQQLMMNQNAAMQNQMGRGMGQNQQQGFQHLQHQMQASQIPQQGQMGVNMGNQGGQPIGPNQQMFQMPGAQGRPQNGIPTDASNLTPHDQQKVMELAQKMAAACPDPQKNHYRNIVQTRFAQRAQEYTAQGKDPVLIWFQHQAFQGLSKNAAMARQRQQQGGMPPNMNQAQAQALMQAGRGQMNPAMMNAAGMQSGTGDFGQFNTMESIMNQQKAGILAQEQGQMVVPASGGPARNATPQPIAGGQGQGMPNQPGQSQTPRPPQAQQQLSMQQAQQLKMEQQQSQHAAQMRAQQQARQLQGQPNGLGGAPPSQSPGMNTLNTPMRRPPSAMNPMEGQGGAQANGAFAGTLDPRFNQGNQRPMSTGGNMNMNNNPIFHNMMASMNPEQRQAVHGLPPDKLHEVMTKWQEQQRKMQMSAMAQAGNTPGQMQGRPGQLGQFNMPNGNQFITNGMMPQQAQQGNPPNNQQALIAQQQQMLARLRNQGTPVAPAHQVMMDSMDLPPPVLAQVGSQLRAPPEVRKWKDLRQWLAQNPVQAQLQQHLERIQRSQFATYMQRQMEKRNREQQMTQQQVAQQQQQQQPQQQPQQPAQQQQQQPSQQQPQQQQQPQPQPQPQQNPMQAGNAAPNQQMPNQPGMPPGMPNIPAHMIQVTQHDILNARKANPKIASLTDDQLRQFIIQIKQRQMAAAMQKEMVMRQAQQAAQGMQGGQGPQNVAVSAPQPPQPHMAQPGGSQANATAPTPAKAPQSVPPKQQSATPDAKAVANAAAPRNNTNNNRPTSNNQQQQQPPNPSPATGYKNLKRPSTDDPIDVPQTAAQQPQRPAAVPGQMRPLPNLTPEQIASMTPEQKAKYELMKSRQQAMQAANPGIAPTENDFDKLRRIGQEEQRLMMTEHMPDISMTPEQRQETCAKLMKIVVDMGKIGKALGRWYAATRDDARAKSYFRARLRMIRQFTDGEVMMNPKPVFSVRPAEIDEVRRLLESMARDCANLGKKAGAAPPQQGQPTAPNQAGASAQGGQPAPLSAANLEKQTQALHNMHSRSNSKSGPPAAPTTSQPPFPFIATSPHGQPAYIGKPKVNRDNLQLPARKKAKTGEQPTPPQPNQATPSPQISKSGSPELKRQTMPEAKAPPKPMFLCPEADCEMATTGFPSEQARQAHVQEEHVKPLEDPMKFMQENLALSLGLDMNGQVKMEPQTAQPMGQNLSKQGQTPASNPAATPMSRDASMQRSGSKMGGKPQDNKLAAGKADDTPKLENKQPEMAAVPAAPMDPWITTIDPQSLFNNLGKFELGASGVISDMGVYRSLTPNDTPESSKDSGSSEPNSDISEGVHLDIDLNWQPVDVDLLLDMNSINMDGLENLPDGGGEFEGLMLEEAMPMEQFPNWDEVTNDFNKPFQFDNSLYSLDVSSST